MRQLLIAVALAGMAVSWSGTNASAQDANPIAGATIDNRATNFGVPDTRSMPAISPNGTRLAVLEWNNETEVAVYDVGDPGNIKLIVKTPAQKTGNKTLRHDKYLGLNWLSDTKLFLSLAISEEHPSCRGEPKCFLVENGQMGLLDLETMKLTSPFKDKFPNFLSNALVTPSRDQGDIVYWPENFSERALIELFESRHGKKGYPTIYTLDPTSIELEKVMKSKTRVVRWIADTSGEIRIGVMWSPSGRQKLTLLNAETDKWETVKLPAPKEERTFALVALKPNSNEAYALSNHETDLDALYLYDLSKEAFVKQVYVHDQYDVSSVDIDRDGNLEAVTAGEEYVPMVDVHSRPLELISRTGFKATSFSQRDADWSENRIIYEVGASGEPGTFFLFDKTLDAVWPIGPRREEPTDSGFASITPFKVKARDGLELETYVAFPHGVRAENASHIPFVVMPHGGPWARDFATYDSVSQFVNSLGFGVVKVNFRGSDGYGASFEEMGVGEWGGAMQDDLNDVRDWVVTKNWADPNRICMVGWSYGGYASLMASIQDSDKYKCAASIAGVSDLFAIVKETESKEQLRRIGARHRFDRKSVVQSSPIERVSEVGIPIFLAHGTDDDIVPYKAHYVAMLKALRNEDKPVDFVAFKNGDHSLTNHYDRQILFDRLGAFLNKHLGPDN